MLPEHLAFKPVVLDRDRNQCVECGAGTGLTLGHRQSSGMGGRGPKAPALTAADFVTQCVKHNEAAEAEGQERALERGHKIRRNTMRPADSVPFYDYGTGLWWRPDRDGKRWPISDADAQSIIAAVNFGR